MAQVIIFQNDNGGVSVVRPVPAILKTRTIQQVAAKDVPAGKSYKIIDEADLPSRDFRDAWTVDEADLTDGVGNTSNKWE
jgi:hypothetical protein